MSRAPRSRVISTLLGGLLLLAATVYPSSAGVHESSKFLDARLPMSRLDYRLTRLQDRWNDRFVDYPHAKTAERYPLIAEAATEIYLSHDGHSDAIDVVCHVRDSSGFASFAAEEREQFLVDIVQAIPEWLGAVAVADGDAFAHEPILDRRTFRVSLLIGTKAQQRFDSLTSRLPLSGRLGVDLAGQAGYADGRYAYSTDSYLNVSYDGTSWSRGSGDGKFVVRED